MFVFDDFKPFLVEKWLCRCKFLFLDVGHEEVIASALRHIFTQFFDKNHVQLVLRSVHFHKLFELLEHYHRLGRSARFKQAEIGAGFSMLLLKSVLRWAHDYGLVNDLVEIGPKLMGLARLSVPVEESSLLQEKYCLFNDFRLLKRFEGLLRCVDPKLEASHVLLSNLIRSYFDTLPK